MTFGALFREVWLELHPDKNNEEHFKWADTVSPSGINDEIPEDQVEELRQLYLAQGRKIDAEDSQEVLDRLKQRLSNN